MKTENFAVMNSLLKLDFFKSLGFISKENGMEFIKDNPKLKKAIDQKVDEMEESKYQIIESIKEKIFPKFENEKNMFIVKIKSKRTEKLANKKSIEKKVLKDELREELLEELRNEERIEKQEKIKKKYPKAYLSNDNELISQISRLEELFSNVIKKIDNGDIDEDNIIIVEKNKASCEKALESIKKVILVMEKLNQE